jgi:hypothetical protein
MSLTVVIEREEGEKGEEEERELDGKASGEVIVEGGVEDDGE